MQQSRLRPGDNLDDYCPRERRVTNHVVVAMIEDQVKQTRCSTCETEHVYKAAKLPARRRKKEAPEALYEQVLAGMPEEPPRGQLARPGAPPAAGVSQASHPSSEASREAAGPAEVDTADEAVAENEPPGGDEGPVHRRLIRATLPRPEGQAPARPVPDFTIRQTAQRNGNPGAHHYARDARGSGRGPAGSRPPAGGAGQGGRTRGPRASDRFSSPGGGHRRQRFVPQGRRRSK